MQETYRTSYTPRKDSRPHNERFPRHEGTSYHNKVKEGELAKYYRYDDYSLINKILLHITDGAPLKHEYLEDIIKKLEDCEKIQNILQIQNERKINHSKYKHIIESYLSKKRVLNSSNLPSQPTENASNMKETTGGWNHHDRIDGFSYSFYENNNHSPFEKNPNDYPPPEKLTLIEQIKAHINKDIGMPLNLQVLRDAIKIISNCDKNFAQLINEEERFQKIKERLQSRVRRTRIKNNLIKSVRTKRNIKRLGNNSTRLKRSTSPSHKKRSKTSNASLRSQSI